MNRIMVLTMKKLVTSKIQPKCPKVFLIYSIGMLNKATINTQRNMELFNKCITPWNLVLPEMFLEVITLQKDFLKFSAPPLFQRNCWERAALITTGSSAGVSTSSKYLNFQFFN